MQHTKFQVIGCSVLEKKIFYVFYHIWAWWPSWSCDHDHLKELSFPQPTEPPHKIWLQLAQCLLRRCLKMLTTLGTTDDECLFIL